MVPEPTSPETTTELPSDVEASSVIDTTPPEALAKEAAWERGENIDDPEPVEAATGAQDAEEGGAGVEQPATPTPQAATEQPAEKPQATEEKSAEEDLTVPKHSEESMRLAQAKWNTELTETRQQHAEELLRVNQRLTDFDISAKVEAYLQAEIQSASTTMSAEEAERFVRAPTRVSTIREGFEARAETERLQQQTVQQGQVFEQNAKTQVVQQFAQEYGLSQADSTALMGMSDPQSMLTMAQRLGELGKQAAVVNAVPAETAATKVGSGVSGTNSQPSDATRITNLRNKTPPEMSDAEYADWTRHAVGPGL